MEQDYGFLRSSAAPIFSYTDWKSTALGRDPSNGLTWLYPVNFTSFLVVLRWLTAFVVVFLTKSSPDWGN